MNNMKTKKIKVLTERSEFEETEVEFPIYSHIKKEYSDIFIKITENKFSKITIHSHGAIELLHCKNVKYISSLFIVNKSDKQMWDIAVLNTKKLIKLL